MSKNEAFRDYLLTGIEYKLNVFYAINPIVVEQLENEKDCIEKLTDEELVSRYPQQYKTFMDK